MKLGTENRIKTIAAVVLVALAAISIVRGMMRPAATVAESAPAETTPANGRPQRVAQRSMRRPARSKTGAPILTASQDPRLRADLLKLSEDTKYAGTGRNIFNAEAEPPPRPITPVITTKQPPPGPAPPPPPPPIPLRFVGFASRTGEPKKAFLSQGDSVFVAAEGEMVNNRYKIVHIGVNSVEIQDVLYNNTQTIPLTQG